MARFEHLIDDIVHLPDQAHWIEMLSNPHNLQDLAKLLGASDFLWEDFIRIQYESLLPMLTQQHPLQNPDQYPETLAQRFRKAVDTEEGYHQKKHALNKFKKPRNFSH